MSPSVQFLAQIDWATEAAVKAAMPRLPWHQKLPRLPVIYLSASHPTPKRAPAHRAEEITLAARICDLVLSITTKVHEHSR